MIYVINDERHDEWQSEHATLREAINELQRLTLISWDQEPNRAPCVSWRTCGREYEIVEYDPSVMPWREVQRLPALEINRAGVRWAKGV
jgi:hypothetical protein